MWASKVRGMVQLPPTGMSSSYEYFQESAACFAVLLLPTAATHRNNRKSLSFLQKRSIIFQSASNLRESFEYIKRGEKDISPPFFSFTFLLIQLSVSLFMCFVSARWNFSRLFREKKTLLCSRLRVEVLHVDSDGAAVSSKCLVQVSGPYFMVAHFVLLRSAHSNIINVKYIPQCARMCANVYLSPLWLVSGIVFEQDERNVGHACAETNSSHGNCFLNSVCCKHMIYIIRETYLCTVHAAVWCFERSGHSHAQKILWFDSFFHVG